MKQKHLCYLLVNEIYLHVTIYNITIMHFINHYRYACMKQAFVFAYNLTPAFCCVPDELNKKKLISMCP